MQTVQTGRIYRHYKGNLYQVLYIALHTETEEPLVIYQALYGERKIWARPLDMFAENVTLPDGNVAARFALVDDEV